MKTRLLLCQSFLSLTLCIRVKFEFEIKTLSMSDMLSAKVKYSLFEILYSIYQILILLVIISMINKVYYVNSYK